ncbi:MAG: amidohydrolase family protein [Niabella sp.]
MKQIFTYIIFSILAAKSFAQDDIYPAQPQATAVIIKNGTIYTATGSIVEHGTIVIKAGKITAVGNTVADETGATVIDATGKNIYPGLILANTDLGLKEIGNGVRGSNDYYELGAYNPSVKAILAYNADSKIINTLRSNGILLACIVPEGSLLTGTSSVVQLDAWNWQDALYKADNGLHLDMPSLMPSGRRRSGGQQDHADPVKEGIKTIEKVEQFFEEARAYCKQSKKEDTNLKFEALRPLFEKKQKLFVHADIARQILVAIDFVKKFDINVVVVGGSDSYLLADLLKRNNIAVILNALHSLPTMQDDDIDQPFKTPAMLQEAGVLYAISDNAEEPRYRNVSFNAGTAAAYGLSKEQALEAITINPAKILGIDAQTGTLEIGKDANIIISRGDILDMKSAIITDAFIQGRKIDLSNKQTQLYERYKLRYGLN